MTQVAYRRPPILHAVVHDGPTEERSDTNAVQSLSVNDD
jgi:hypothetical protein